VSPRGRRELLAVGLFCAAGLAGPLFFQDLYPFSQAPMFADAPRCYCRYAVLDPAGRPLPPGEFGLGRDYWGNPVGVGVGFRPPPTVDRFGQVAPREAVTAAVREGLAGRADLGFVDVVQEVVGPLGDGGVGVVRSGRWRVSNPRPRGTAP
jgi:hypothetical protein